MRRIGGGRRLVDLLFGIGGVVALVGASEQSIADRFWFLGGSWVLVALGLALIGLTILSRSRNGTTVAYSVAGAIASSTVAIAVLPMLWSVFVGVDEVPAPDAIYFAWVIAVVAPMMFGLAIGGRLRNR